MKTRTVLPTKDKKVCGRIRKEPLVVVGDGGAVKDSIVFLKDVVAGKPWLEMSDGERPVLDGEGTRRTQEWLATYFQDPATLVPGTAHDGSLGPDLRMLGVDERELLVAFLSGLKANPGSPNHPRPPPEPTVKGGG